LVDEDDLLKIAIFCKNVDLIVWKESAPKKDDCTTVNTTTIPLSLDANQSISIIGQRQGGERDGWNELAADDSMVAMGIVGTKVVCSMSL